MAAVEGTTTTKKKVIIDTDPGIDDAMAIFVALRSSELEVLGLTTTFSNVHTALATGNALHLLEAVGRTDVPVAEGSHVTIKGMRRLPMVPMVLFDGWNWIFFFIKVGGTAAGWPAKAASRSNCRNNL